MCVVSIKPSVMIKAILVAGIFMSGVVAVTLKQQFKKQGDELRNAIKGVYEEYNTDKEQQDWEIPEEPVYLDWEDEVP